MGLLQTILKIVQEYRSMYKEFLLAFLSLKVTCRILPSLVSVVPAILEGKLTRKAPRSESSLALLVLMSMGDCSLPFAAM